MPAALDGFKTSDIFNIFSGDVSEKSKFKSLNLIDIVGCDFRYQCIVRHAWPMHG